MVPMAELLTKFQTVNHAVPSTRLFGAAPKPTIAEPVQILMPHKPDIRSPQARNRYFALANKVRLYLTSPSALERHCLRI